MSLREKVGQLVMFSVSGYGLTEHERNVMRRAHLGGVILFERNYRDKEQLRRLTAQIQAAARLGNEARAGALISVDQEGGIVKRMDDMPPWYSAPEMGRRRVGFSRRQGKKTGRALKRHGINVDLAPVADLDSPPEHVMRERSFGSHASRVAKRVRAFGLGLQSHHVAATAKHFPGIGSATQNTDYGPAYVDRSRKKLRHADMRPFRFAQNVRFRLMMVSHAIYVNEGGRVPASMSDHIVKDLLRRHTDYNGVAISDALEAVLWRFDGNLSKACKKTIDAGVDIALITGGVDKAEQCADAIVRAVRNGEISKDRIDEAAARVLSVKTWAGVGP